MIKVLKCFFISSTRHKQCCTWGTCIFKIRRLGLHYSILASTTGAGWPLILVCTVKENYKIHSQLQMSCQRALFGSCACTRTKSIRSMHAGAGMHVCMTCQRYIPVPRALHQYCSTGIHVVQYSATTAKMATYAVSVSSYHGSKTVWTLVANITLEGTFLDLFNKFNKDDSYKCISASVSVSPNGPWQDTSLKESLMANLIRYNKLEFKYQTTVAPHFKFEISCLGYIKPIKIFNIKQKYCTRFYTCIL